MKDPLVLLPAMMCDVGVFEHQISALSRDRSVIAAPVGQFERIEEIASDLLDALPARFAVFGLSFGGLVGMELMRRAPDRITRICLMGCSPLAEAPVEAASREPLMISARMGKLEEAMRGTLLPDHLAPGPGRIRVMGDVMRMAAALGPEVFVRQSRALQKRRDQQGTMRRAKIPTLIACGELDTLVPPRRHHFLADLMPNAELHVIPGAGHLPPLEQPDATLEMLRDWLAAPLVLR